MIILNFDENNYQTMIPNDRKKKLGTCVTTFKDDATLVKDRRHRYRQPVSTPLAKSFPFTAHFKAIFRSQTLE